MNEEQRINMFVGKLNDLFTMIKTLANDRGLQFVEEQTILREYQLDTYKAPELRLTSSKGSIEVIPIGTIILGAFGRVDVTGPKGKTMLLLTEDGRWGTFFPDTPLELNSRVVEVTPEVLAKIVEAVA